MRDYALTCAAMNGQIGVSPLQLVANCWQRARLARNLPAGCTAEDRRWLASLSASVNPKAALADRLERRERGLASR